MEKPTEINRVRVLTFPGRPKATIRSIGPMEAPCIVELDEEAICDRNPVGQKWVIVNYSELGDV